VYQAYSSAQESYHLLGKSAASMDQLHMHVASAVHNTAWNVVYGHAVLTHQHGEAGECHIYLRTDHFTDWVGML